MRTLKKLLPLVVLVLAAYLTFKPSFFLAHSGDDWLTFYRYKKHLGEWSFGQFNHLTYFLTPYGPQDIYFGILQKFFGYNSPHLYYYFSFFLRILASLAIYFFLTITTKNRLAALLASSFFAVSPIGAQATDWVFNMPSYIAIALVVAFFYFLLKSQEKQSLKIFLVAVFFYVTSFISQPIRMHGLPFVALAVDTYWLIQNRKLKIFKSVIQRQSLLIATLLFIRFFVGQSMGSNADLINKLSSGLGYASTAINQRDFGFLLHPFVITGRFFIPEEVLPIINQIPLPSYFLRILVAAFALFLPLLLLLRQIGKKAKVPPIILPLLIFLMLIWAIGVRAIGKNYTSYLDPAFTGAAVLGGFFVLFSLATLATLFKERLSNLLFLGVAWTFLSFAYPWLWTPNATFGTTHRYFIVSSLGIVIFWGALVSLAYKARYKIPIILTALVFVLIHSLSTNNHFSHLADVRGVDKFNKVWSSIPYVDEVTTNPPVLFYFEGNGALTYHLVTFGFPAHMGLRYNYEQENRLPIPVDRWEDLVSAVSDGKNLTAFGYEAKPLSIKKVYAFRIADDAELVDITEDIRERLRNSIAND